MNLLDCRITIVGLGLMGGSLAKALRGRCAEIAGVDANPVAVAFALDRGLIDRAAEFDGVSVDDVPDADILVLAAPVRAILSQLNRLSESTIQNPKSTVVIDLGSTKSEIVSAMNALPPQFDPIGGHPLCGKEASGIAAAEANLFQGAFFALCPLPRTSPRALSLARQIVHAIGARPRVLDAAHHDRLVATTSHLPYLFACALVAAAERLNDDLAWCIAASGFRDTSRLAASGVTMMSDILRTNRAEILHALSSARAEVDRLAGLIAEEDWPALCASLNAIHVRRSQLFDADSLRRKQSDAVEYLWPGA